MDMAEIRAILLPLRCALDDMPSQNIFRPKTMDYSPWFDFNLGVQKNFGEKATIGHAVQEEQNDASFSFVAPSS